MSIASAKHASTTPAADAPPRPWRLWIIAAAAVVVITGGVIMWAQWPNAGADPTHASAADWVWYSNDDGKTWFADRKNPLNCVTRDGRLAYRTWVYTCDGGKTTFVAYLQRYSPQAQKQLQAYADGKQVPQPRVLEQITTTGVEVKRPGAATWINATDERGWDIQQPTCPDGGTARPQVVPAKP